VSVDPLLALGFAGQACFMARVLWQWIVSERAGHMVVPRGYWHLSLLAAALVLAYTIGVNNPIFALSVIPGAVVSARNMLIRRSVRSLHLLPAAAALVALTGLAVWVKWSEPRVGPLLWGVVGVMGSVMWGARIVVQWWISERRGVSTLPRAYWLLSLAGCAFLLAYACSRLDPVMIAGYAFGGVPYVRNLMLLRAQPAR